MSMRAMIFRFLTLLPLASAPATAYSITYCGMPPEGGPPEPLPPVTWYEVPAQDFMTTNPRFAGIFTVYTDWNWSQQDPTGPADDRWGITRLREFAHFLVDEDPGVEPNTDLANVILAYCARDEDPGPGIAIQNRTALDEVTRRFRLQIHDTAQHITAGRDSVRVHIKNSGEYGSAVWLLPEQVAKDAFAHEWQHTCHTYYTRGPHPDYTPDLPPEDVIVHEWGLGLGHEFDEMCSKLSEALFGVGREVSTHETLCTTHLLKAPGYMNSCACVDLPSAPVDCLEPRYQYTDYGLFSNYINQKFAATVGNQTQDLFTRWLPVYTEDATGDTIYHHDAEALASLLDDDPAFDAYFTGAALFGSGNEGRWRELMHKYAVAKFANLQGFEGPGDTLLQWLPEELVGEVNVNSPQYRYGLFDHKDEHWYKKIHVYPLYFDAADAPARLEGVYSGCEIWPGEFGTDECVNPPSHWPSWAYYAHGFKQAEVSTYAASYLVFRAPAANSGTLRLRLGIAEQYGCIVGAEGAPYGSSVVLENTDDLAGQGLYYTLLGYRDLTAAPHPETQPLTEVNSASQIDILAEGYLENLNIGSGFEVLAEDFGLPGAGGTYAACALVLSAAENAIPAGGEDEAGRIIPYWLEYDVVPQVSFTPGHITSPTTWGPDETRWVEESIVIDPQVTLTILENTRVWLAGAADAITVDGTLDIRGQEGEPVIIAATALFGGSGELATIAVSTGAACSMNEARIEGLGRFDLASNVATFSLSGSDLYFSDADALAGLQSEASQGGDIAITECNIWNAVTLELAGAEVANCELHQRLVGLGDHPLVVVDRGETTIAGTFLEFLNQGIDTAPQSSKSGFTVQLLLDVATLEGVDAGNSTALNLQLNSRAEVQDCLMQDGLATAIEANYGSWLYVRGTEIQATDVCVLAGRGSAVDLGVLLPPPDGYPPYEFDVDDPGNNLIYNTSPDCRLADECCPLGGGQICEETVPKGNLAVRVSNRTAQQIWALGNYWGNCICEEEYYAGSPVFYADSVLVPPGAGGCSCSGIGGGLSVVAGGAAEPGPPDYQLRSGPVFGQECVIARAPGAWARLVREASVYDVSGRLVRRLALNGAGGERALVWDGRDEVGRSAATGVYFIRIAERSRKVHFKVIKLR